MMRFLFAAVALWCLLPALDADAQQRQRLLRRSSMHSTHRYPPAAQPRFGTPGSIPHYGYGYVYDPYRSGSFEPPDLLDEPYFQTQHKFESRYPGRYAPPRLQLQPGVDWDRAAN